MEKGQAKSIQNMVEAALENKQKRTEYEAECARLRAEIMAVNDKLDGKVSVEVQRGREYGTLLRSLGTIVQPPNNKLIKVAFLITDTQILAYIDTHSTIVEGTVEHNNQIQERDVYYFREYTGDLMVLQEAIAQSIENASKPPPHDPRELTSVKVR